MVEGWDAPVDIEPGRKKFLAEMLDRYADMVFRLSLTYLRSPDDAQDAVQEVFLRLFTANTHFNEESHVKAWLLKVTANYCRNLLKSPWHKRVLKTDEIAACVEDEEKSDVVRDVLGLPAKYRDVIYLFYYEPGAIPRRLRRFHILHPAPQGGILKGYPAAFGGEVHY